MEIRSLVEGYTVFQSQTRFPMERVQVVNDPSITPIWELHVHRTVGAAKGDIYRSSSPNSHCPSHHTTETQRNCTRQRSIEREKLAKEQFEAAEMYQAIPYSAGRLPSWPRRAAAMASTAEPEVAGAADQGRLVDAAGARDGGEAVRRAVAESPVVVVGRRGCCLSHVVKRLLQGLGVNPAVHEIADEAELAALASAEGEVAALPAVFVGGRLLGGLDRLMAVHISGELVPILKSAGALWL
ncbi:hypothetical protein ACQ4PT_032060 [Festuca glaucescens]